VKDFSFKEGGSRSDLAMVHCI